MKKKLLNVLKILPGPGNKLKNPQIIKVPKAVHNFLTKTKYAKDVDQGSEEFTEEVIKTKGNLKDPPVSKIKSLIRNMAEAQNDKKTLDFLNKPNPADKPKSKKPPSISEREFNLDKNNAIKQIDDTLNKLRKNYSKASPGVQKNIIRQADKLNKKKDFIKNSKFSARVKASKETPLFDIAQDIKRTTTFMENVVKNVSESRKIENQLSLLRKKYTKAKNKSEQDAIVKKAKNLLNKTTTYTQQDKSFALSSLANPEYGLATSRLFGGKGPRQETAKRTGKTLNPSTDTVKTQEVIVDKKGKVIGKKPGTKPNVKKVQTSSDLKGSKLTTTGDVQDEAAAVRKGAEQLRGVGNLTQAEQKQLQNQIREYITGGGKITKGPPSKGTAPDDTSGLRDPLVEAQRLLGVDAPSGFSPTNMEQKIADKLNEEAGILRNLRKNKASSSEIKKAANKVTNLLNELKEIRKDEVIDVYDLPASQRKELKIGSSGIANPSNKKGAGPDADEPVEEMKKGGRLRKRKPKRVVRGVGAAKRGYGKANYSNKMY